MHFSLEKTFSLEICYWNTIDFYFILLLTQVLTSFFHHLGHQVTKITCMVGSVKWYHVCYLEDVFHFLFTCVLIL